MADDVIECVARWIHHTAIAVACCGFLAGREWPTSAEPTQKGQFLLRAAQGELVTHSRLHRQLVHRSRSHQRLRPTRSDGRRCAGRPRTMVWPGRMGGVLLDGRQQHSQPRTRAIHAQQYRAVGMVLRPAVRGPHPERVPVQHSLTLHRALHIYQDIDCELIIYPNEGHGLTKYSHRLAKLKWDIAWFEKYLLGKEE